MAANGRRTQGRIFAAYMVVNYRRFDMDDGIHGMSFI
jgi:hypothetical protein